MWDKEILSSGINILVKDFTSLVLDQSIHPLDDFSLSQMDHHDGFY